MDGKLLNSGTQSSNIKAAKAKKKKKREPEANISQESRQNSLKTIVTKNNLSRTVIDEDLPGTSSTHKLQPVPDENEVKAMSEEKILLTIVSKKVL